MWGGALDTRVPLPSDITSCPQSLQVSARSKQRTKKHPKGNATTDPRLPVIRNRALVDAPV